MIKEVEKQEKARLSSSGIEVKKVYGLTGSKIDGMSGLGFPGVYPFTRGIYPTMYRGRLWTMRQYAGFGTAEETNERFKFLLKQGQMGLSMALDLPTQLGLDSDDPQAEGEVGRVGVAVDTLEDMEIIFRDLPLDALSTSITVNATASILLAMYVAVGKKQGVPSNKLMGTLQNDILKEYVARGTWIYPTEPSLRLIVDTIEYCSEHLPRLNPISITSCHYQDAGATPVQAAAYFFADAITYIERTLERGLSIDSFAPRLSSYHYTHSDFFEEIAKYRAMRRLWARMMKERFGAQDPNSWLFRFGTPCGGASLTVAQPMNNVVRVAYEALASILAGTQTIHTGAWDEGYSIPTQESADLALKTQLILAHETGVTQTVDPLGGSYFVEVLTNQVEGEIQRRLNRIEVMGGMVRAVENGVIQREIIDSAYEREKKIQSGEKVVVGVNRFVQHSQEEEGDLDLHQYDSQVPDRQGERLRRIRQERDRGRVKRSLEQLRRVAEGQENVVPYLIEAVEAYATLGEISRVFREVFGEFREPVGI